MTAELRRNGKNDLFNQLQSPFFLGQIKDGEFRKGVCLHVDEFGGVSENEKNVPIQKQVTQRTSFWLQINDTAGF